MTANDDLQLLLARDIAGLPNQEALQHIGLLIDASSDAQSSQGTDRAFEMLDQIQSRSLPQDVAALAHYFRANAWESRRLSRTDRDAWTWEQPEAQEQILDLRRAINHAGFAQLDSIRQCQILTNLANQLNTIGRFVEAVDEQRARCLIEPLMKIGLIQIPIEPAGEMSKV